MDSHPPVGTVFELLNFIKLSITLLEGNTKTEQEREILQILKRSFEGNQDELNPPDLDSSESSSYSCSSVQTSDINLQNLDQVELSNSFEGTVTPVHEPYDLISCQDQDEDEEADNSLIIDEDSNSQGSRCGTTRSGTPYTPFGSIEETKKNCFPKFKPGLPEIEELNFPTTGPPKATFKKAAAPTYPEGATGTKPKMNPDVNKQRIPEGATSSRPRIGSSETDIDIEATSHIEAEGATGAWTEISPIEYRNRNVNKQTEAEGATGAWTESSPRKRRFKNVNKQTEADGATGGANPRRRNVNKPNKDDNNEQETADREEEPETDLNRRNDEFKKNKRITPIIIRDNRYSWKQIKDILYTNHINSSAFQGEIKGANSYNITSRDEQAQRNITKILDNEGVYYHSYTLPTDKLIKVVIRGLPRESDAQEINDELIQEGYSIDSVKQMTSRREGVIHPLPLFLIALKRSDRSRNIHNCTYLLNLKISVETYRGRSGPTQCHRCQQFWHSSNSCRHEPKCVKCGEPHLTASCKKLPEEDPKCANCGGPHTASYPKCEKFPVPIKKNPGATPHPRTETKTYESRIVNSRTYADATQNIEDSIQLHKVVQDLKAEFEDFKLTIITTITNQMQGIRQQLQIS